VTFLCGFERFRLSASDFSLRAQRKVTKRKCAPADGRYATPFISLRFVAPVRQVILTCAALEWPSLAISTSRSSFFSILQGVVKGKGKG
jgi:hypothetical protein